MNHGEMSIPIVEKFEVVVVKGGVAFVGGEPVDGLKGIHEKVDELLKPVLAPNRVALSVDQAVDEVLSWVKPFTRENLFAIPGIGDHKAGIVLEKLKHSGRLLEDPAETFTVVKK